MGKDQELLEAARIGNFSAVEKLLFPKSKSSSLAASLGIRVGAYINCQDQSGYTPLHHASLNGHSTIVKILLDAGAAVNIPDTKGSFALHLAAWNDYSEIVHLLLATGPNFASINEQNGDQETALHCAAQHGHANAAKVLLENHADPQIRNIRDESALDLASQYGRLDVVRMILSFHPKILGHSPERFTPLHLASRNGHRGVVELLLAHGADIDRVGANGTALHEAAIFGKCEVVSLLLKRGAATNCKDSGGRTALELVSQLDTRISREIGKLIVDRIQEGDDYEPLPPVAMVTPRKAKKTVKEMKASMKLRDAANVSVSTSSLNRNFSRSFGEADLADHSSLNRKPSPAASFRLGSTRSRLKGGLLRRTSSARSSRSLPRLASSSSFHGKSSLRSFATQRKKSDALSIQDWSVRQHHPSIDMFPVNSLSERKTSVSEPSSPQLGFSHMHDSNMSINDSDVFLPTSQKPIPKAIIPLKPPAENEAVMSQSMERLESASDLKSPGAPKKPTRNKPALNPPPLPPKPAHMVKSDPLPTDSTDQEPAYGNVSYEGDSKNRINSEQESVTGLNNVSCEVSKNRTNSEQDCDNAITEKPDQNEQQQSSEIEILSNEYSTDSNSELKSQSAEIKRQRSELKTQSSGLETQSADLKSESSQLESQNSELRRSLELKTQGSGLKTRSSELKSDSSVNTRGFELNPQSSELETQSSEIEELSNDNASDSDSELKSMNSGLKTRSSEIKALSNENIGNSDSELATQSSELQTPSSGLKTHTSDCLELEGSPFIENSSNCDSQLQTQSSPPKNQSSELEARSSQLQSQSSELKNSWPTTQHAELETQNSELTAQNS